MAGILSSPNIQKLLANTSLNLEQKRDTLEDLYGSPVQSVTLTFLSSINSIFLTNTDTEKLASDVTFKFNLTSVSPWTGAGGGEGRGCSVAHPLAKVSVSVSLRPVWSTENFRVELYRDPCPKK